MKSLKSRLSDHVDRSARGTDIPAGIERESGTGAPTGSRDRGRMRRRLRELRRLREASLLELGALVLEAHRHERDDSPVIKRKAAEAAGVDAEARAIADALGADGAMGAIVAAGIAGPCPACGTLASTSARFCSACGTALDGRPEAARASAVAGQETVEVASEKIPDPDEDPQPSTNGNGASPEETGLGATTRAEP